MSSDPISDTDGIFARAFAGALKTKFQIDVGEHFVILTSPITQRGLAAGDLIYPQMTNYLTYKFADALQFSDNPNYTGGSAGSYIQQLRSYLDWVKTSGNPSQVIVVRMAQARDNFTLSNENYFNVLHEGVAQYNQVKELFPGLTFWEWAEANYPPLANADTIRKRAETELYAAMDLYFGPEAPILSRYMDNIAGAQSSNPLPDYNTDGLVDDQDLISNAIKDANGGSKLPEQTIAQSTIRVPEYSIPTYVNLVQAWITAGGHGATRDEIIPIDIRQGQSTKWEDYGFKEVHSGGGDGFWPFFHAEVYINNQWEERTLDTKGRETELSLQLAMIGLQKFDINPGLWDVANIKTSFPNRLPAAPDVLSPKFARVLSLIVGYDVELRVEFASSIREEVDRIYEEVKSTGGRMSVFGFRVSAGEGGGSSSDVETRFDDIKWDRTNGLMTLVPTSGQVYPTILGAVAQRFD